MTLNGIDIASWQAGIVPSATDADFIIVKATGGITYENPYWRQWADDVLASGKLLGLYHYANDYGWHRASDEARWFLDHVASYKGRFIPMLDVEAEALGNSVDWSKTWLDAVAAETGATPWFYTGASAANARDWSAISRYPLWMACYYDRYAHSGFVDQPYCGWSTGSWARMACHQYTSEGRIAGYGGNLDLNAFFGTREDWIAMEGGSMADNSQLVDFLMPISTNYVFGGSRFEPYDTDCSGVVCAAFWHVHGVSPYTLGTWTGDMWASGATREIWRGTTPNLPWDIMKKGDIIFSGYTSPDFNTGNGSHVGLYTGDPSAPFLSHFRNGGPEVTGMMGVYGNERYFGVKRYMEGEQDMTPQQAEQLEFIYNHMHWRESDHFSDLGNLVAEFPVEYETIDEAGEKSPLTQPLGKRIGYIDQRIHAIEANQAAMGEKLDKLLEALVNKAPAE